MGVYGSVLMSGIDLPTQNHQNKRKFSLKWKMLNGVIFPLRFRCPLYIENHGAFREFQLFITNSFFIDFIWSIHSSHLLFKDPVKLTN